MTRSMTRLVCAAALLCATAQARADDASVKPVLSKHQMMKQCMAKQKASDGGIPKEQMKQNCRDITKTASENAKADKTMGDTVPGTPHD